MKNNTITIKNELPELLEAVCEHPKCPEWLKHDIWDSFSNRNSTMSYKAIHWASVLDNLDDHELKDDREPGICRRVGCNNVIDVMDHCLDCAEKIVARFDNKAEVAQ